MTISYENTEQDAVAWNEYRVLGIAQNRRAVKTWRVRVTLLAAVLFFLLLHTTHVFGNDPLRHLLWAICFALAAGGGNALAMRRNLSRQTKLLKKQGTFHAFLGPRTVTFGPEGIRSRHAGGEALYLWHTIRDVAITPTHFAVSLGPQEFTFLPRRAFGSEAREQEFLALVERYRTGAALGTLPLASTNAPSVSSASTGSVPWYQARYSVDVDTPDKQSQQVNRTS